MIVGENLSILVERETEMTLSGKFPHFAYCRMSANCVWVIHRRDRDLELQASLISLPGSPYEKEKRASEK